MTNKDLLKESLVDAKNLKELAISNAKEQLQEAFGSKIQSLVSKKLREEEEDEMEDDVEFTELESEEDEIPVDDEEEETPTEDAVTESEDTEEEIPVDDEEEVPMEDDEDEVTDEELEEVLRELEGMGDEDTEDEEVDLEEEDEMEDEEIALEIEDDEEEVPMEDDEDEEIDLEEIFGGNDNQTEQIQKLQKENSKLRKALKSVNTTVNEVRLLNTKLLYTNKLFKKYNLKESQKTMVLNTFDRTKTLREVKLVFSSLCESFNSPSVSKRTLKEGFASSPIQTTKPNKKPIVDSDNSLAERMKQLANIKK